MPTHPDSHSPIDKSVILPEAVRSAAAAADALLAGQVPTGGPPPPAGHVETTPIPTGAPPPPAGFTQAPAPVPAPAPAPMVVNGEVLPPSAAPGSAEAQWEHRYRSLRGRMDVERAGNQREMAALRAQVDDLTQRVGLPGASGAPTTVSAGLTPEKRAEFEKTWGPEMTQAMIDIASDIATGAANQVRQTVDKRVDQTQQEAWRQANTIMEATLDHMLPGGNGQPDWRVVNDDEGFISWLQQPDGFSNMTKLQILRDAWNRNDTQAVYKIFAAYMGGHQSLPTGGGPGAAPASQQPSNRLPLHSLAAPGPTRPASPGAPVESETNQYRVSEIAKFFQDKARGIYNDTEARRRWAAGIEADIYAAQKEGRVIQG